MRNCFYERPFDCGFGDLGFQISKDRSVLALKFIYKPAQLARASAQELIVIKKTRSLAHKEIPLCPHKSGNILCNGIVKISIPTDLGMG